MKDRPYQTTSFDSLRPLLPSSKIEILVEGAVTDPQLNHPEGICSDAQGRLWAGGERGEIYRIDPAQKSFEQVASTDGFLLGLNFDAGGLLYLCDSKHKAVFRYNPASGELMLYTKGSRTESIQFPNYPLVDRDSRYLYVSDSHGFQQPGPGVWRTDLISGETELWCRDVFDFANGLALSQDGKTLYVAESWGRCVSAVPIGEDGRAGRKEIMLSLPGTIPDGLYMAADGYLYITSYEPSRIYRYHIGRSQLELVVEDSDAHLFCHPTNCVIVDNNLYASNLGRWHISRVNLEELHS
jgi:gluconolactonase